jgi:hypothetical protein
MYITNLLLRQDLHLYLSYIMQTGYPPTPSPVPTHHAAALAQEHRYSACHAEHATLYSFDDRFACLNLFQFLALSLRQPFDHFVIRMVDHV